MEFEFSWLHGFYHADAVKTILSLALLNDLKP